jgi:hypothetical protein
VAQSPFSFLTSETPGPRNQCSGNTDDPPAPSVLECRGDPPLNAADFWAKRPAGYARAGVDIEGRARVPVRF